MCVLGKDAIENKLDDVFDYFIRDSEVKSSCYTLIAKEKNDIPSDIYNEIKESNNWNEIRKKLKE